MPPIKVASGGLSCNLSVAQTCAALSSPSLVWFHSILKGQTAPRLTKKRKKASEIPGSRRVGIRTDRASKWASRWEARRAGKTAFRWPWTELGRPNRGSLKPDCSHWLSSRSRCRLGLPRLPPPASRSRFLARAGLRPSLWPSQILRGSRSLCILRDRRAFHLDAAATATGETRSTRVFAEPDWRRLLGRRRAQRLVQTGNTQPSWSTAAGSPAGQVHRYRRASAANDIFRLLVRDTAPHAPLRPRREKKEETEERMAFHIQPALDDRPRRENATPISLLQDAASARTGWQEAAARHGARGANAGGGAGASTCSNLSLGFLRWFEGTSRPSVERHAPLILVPGQSLANLTSPQANTN